MDSYSKRMAKYHPIWLETTVGREFLENECIESFFGCESSEVPEESRDLFDTLKHGLNSFLFTRRYDDVPEQPPVYESSGTPDYEDIVTKDFNREN